MRDDGVALKLVAMVRERLAADNLDLPELSPTAATCLQTLRNQGLGFGELASVVDKDSRLASQIIRLANSSAFPSRSPATSLAQSIGRMGAQALQEALVEFAARPVLESRDPRIKDAYRRPWSRALAIAITAERLAQELAQPDLRTPLYLAGILQDIGKPLVAAFLLQVERQTSGPRGPKWMTDDVWQRAIGATFRSVSEAVAKRWHLPAATLRAIGRSAEYEPEAGRAPGAILRFAAAIVDREGFYARRADLDDLETRLGEGRSHLGLDDKTERRATVALKERVLLLAGIRGN
jgi:HD-like signal output (HDOD) protein